MKAIFAVGYFYMTLLGWNHSAMNEILWALLYNNWCHYLIVTVTYFSVSVKLLFDCFKKYKLFCDTFKLFVCFFLSFISLTKNQNKMERLKQVR